MKVSSTEGFIALVLKGAPNLYRLNASGVPIHTTTTTIQE